MNYPKISIITPSYNQGAYLEETILSVLDQRYPNLEYIIIDGNSTDNSVDIIKKYADRISYWVSEPDTGMYDAIQKGFERSTGEIMGWLNSDDILHKKSLFSIAELLTLKGVYWIQGFPNTIDESGRIVQVIDYGQWSFLRFLTDDVCIQQDCTFWRRELWEKAGGYVSTKYSVAGDFELWLRFFKYEKLFTPPCLTGSFRLRKEGQLSMDGNRYQDQVRSILQENEPDADLKKKIEKIKKLNRIKYLLARTKLFYGIMNPRIDNAIRLLNDFPPNIAFSRADQRFEILSDGRKYF